VPGNEVDLDKEMKLSEKERKLVRLIRAIKYGQLTIYIKENQPVRVDRMKESIEL